MRPHIMLVVGNRAPDARVAGRGLLHWNQQQRRHSAR